MIEASASRRSSAFSQWLRTGDLPSMRGADGLELKFNPWHDPDNGRFTFAGTGHHYGSGEANAGSASIDRASARTGRSPCMEDRPPAPSGTPPKAGTARTASFAAVDERSQTRTSVAVQSGRKNIKNIQSGLHSSPVVEFVGGVGEGLYDVARGAAAGIHSAFTTNPVKTIRDAARGVAGMVDTALAAEDTPAHVQVSRAMNVVVDASPRDVGRATGMVGGNMVLAATPAAALSKVAAVRRLGSARPRTIYPPPQVGWVKETLRSDKSWKAYNDAATGARSGQAPTLMRTMPDGSKRPVKFDGIQADYVIDRKLKVVDAPRGRAQLLRQSQVLAEHRLLGTWEVPTSKQRLKGLKMLKRMGVTNIKIRVVEK